MRSRVFQILSPVLVFLLSSGCQTSANNRGNGSEKSVGENPTPHVEEKYRLTEDRKKFEDLRSDIPEEKKIENDEEALVQKLMGEIKHSPSQARDKFDTLARKRRESFNKDMNKVREKFNTEERVSREAFNKSVEKERSQFQRTKRSSEQRKEFFDDLDERRKNFNADVKSKRDDFEAEVREKRRDFEDYMREKTSNFNQEHRVYTQRWNEYQKQKSNPAANQSNR